MTLAEDEVRVRLTPLGGDGKPIDISRYVVGYDLTPLVALPDEAVGDVAHWSSVYAEWAQRPFTLVLSGRWGLTRAQRRRLAVILTGRGGPWKAAHARRYPRGRRRA